MIHIKSIEGFSKQGKRNNNEDFVLFHDRQDAHSRFIILCDGMGGHGHGEIASNTVANAVFQYLKDTGKDEYTAQDLQDALDAATSTLTAVDKYDDEKPMGTTLVVAVVNKMNVLVGHVGDSRCYLFDENGIKKFRTKDHSKVAEAVEAEILTEDEAFESSHKNILTRCIMSGKSDVKIDTDILLIENNDRLLLCSDGVNDAIREKDIEALMINRDSNSALTLIDNICAENSHDNYSAIIVDFLQDEVNPTEELDKTDLNDTAQETIEYLYCTSCRAKNKTDALFCCICGTPLKKNHSVPPERSSIKEPQHNSNSLLWKLLKKALPVLLILLGSIITSVFYEVSNHIKERDSNAAIAKAQLQGQHLCQKFEEASIKFITQMCQIDSTTQPVDSLINKQILKEQYIQFCRKYKNAEVK